MKNKKLFYGILIVAVLVIAGIGLFVLHNSAFAQSSETTIAPTVTITTDKRGYKQGEIIKITVRNGLGISIFYYGGERFWFIEKFEDEKWKNLGYEREGAFQLPILEEGKEVCYIRVYERPDLCELKSNSEIYHTWNQKICPLYRQEKQSFEPELIEAGRYRFGFNYGLSKSSEDPYKLAVLKTIYSSEFTIKNNDVTLKLWMPSVEPDGIFPNVVTDIKFGVLVTGPTSPPNAIQLEEVSPNGNPIRVVGDLKDDGRKGDLMPNDYIYSGVFPITSEKEEKLYYRATVEYGGQVYVSEICMLAVTNFPVSPASSNSNFLVTDSKTGQRFYSNELNVKFRDGVFPERIREIVSSEKASVVGTIPGIGVFQLRIPTDNTPEAVYKAVKAFKAYKEVEYVEPNYELDDK